MADMRDFGQMDVNDRGGKHDFHYDDERHVTPENGATPSQTVGPFFAYGLTPRAYGYKHTDPHSADLTGNEKDVQIITIEGQVFDGEGQSIHDAFVEIVQADALGHYAVEPRNDGFTGYGRCGTGANGPEAKGGDTHFKFSTIKPAATIDAAAPFITVIVTMRGLLNHCITRLYFPDDDHANDAVLQQVPEARRTTLIAKQTAPHTYRFDIHMQGEIETVFFDL